MKFNSKFCDKNYIILEESYNENIHKLKVGIHIHVYYIDMIDIFIKHLINFPIFFDLFITVNLQENKDICLKYFTKEKLIKLNNITIKIVENRGRDIAPWIIEFANIQHNYDLFCHLHTKKSLHNYELKEWAEYLIDNLISEKASKSILTNFVLNDDVSMIFPPIYYQIPIFIANPDKNDDNNISKLLEKLNINFTPDAEISNFVFPAGTMLWYRPKILKPLFDLNFKYEDFPKEPIPVTGTLAHAIERVIGIIGEQANYKIKFYILKEYLIKNMYYLYDLVLYTYNIKQYIHNNDINKLYKLFYMDKSNKLISILEIGKFSLFKIETSYKKIILTIFAIKITIRLGK